jgi:hypothetical protein
MNKTRSNEQNLYRITFDIDETGEKGITGEMSLRNAQLLKSSKIYKNPNILISQVSEENNK